LRGSGCFSNGTSGAVRCFHFSCGTASDRQTAELAAGRWQRQQAQVSSF
jgi:hypothetical protein